MSVLELLELQARARAIRSQLAMEPITKIEVKSDDDDEVPAEKVKRKEKDKRSSKNKESGSRKSHESKAAKEGTLIPSADADSSSKEQSAPRKKIKIKRNLTAVNRGCNAFRGSIILGMLMFALIYLAYNSLKFTLQILTTLNYNLLQVTSLRVTALQIRTQVFQYKLTYSHEICYLLCLQPLFTTHSWKTN